MSGQTRSHSLAESLINVAIGYGISVIAQLLIFPLFGIYITLAQDMAMALIFTVISIVRSYCLRRFFNSVTVGGL